jgi:hypothetical protein
VSELSPEALRADIASLLGRLGGLSLEQIQVRCDEAASHAAFCDTLVEAFVDMGGYTHPIPATRMVRLEDLERLPYTQRLEDALDRRRGQLPFDMPHRLRLGKLYALIGRHEKAASCFREVLASPEPPSMALVVELAEAAARSGRASIALAGVDRVAETILTRDPSEPHSGEDLLRDDPLTAGALLERARDIALRIDQAPRAVALGRAASALYERLGRPAEIRASLAGQVRALQAAGNARKARLMAEKWRDLSRDTGAPVDEAAAQETLADQNVARGQLGQAASLLADAADIFDELNDLPEALRLLRRQGGVQLQDGLVAEARKTLEEARDRAARGELRALAQEIEAERIEVELADGNVGEALAAAQVLCDDWTASGDAGHLASAAVLLAEARILAGDAQGALQALAPHALVVPPGVWEARAIAAQAEAAAILSLDSQARLLLALAARAARSADDVSLAARLILRRGELAFDAGDEASARADLTEAERLGAQGRVEVQLELLQARLAEEEDEAGTLLEELADTVRGGLPEQVKVQAALRAIGRGLDMMGNDLTAPLVERLREVRDALPEPLHAGFVESPLCRPLSQSEGDPLGPLRISDD